MGLVAAGKSLVFVFRILFFAVTEINAVAVAIVPNSFEGDGMSESNIFEKS